DPQLRPRLDMRQDRLLAMQTDSQETEALPSFPDLLRVETAQPQVGQVFDQPTDDGRLAAAGLASEQDVLAGSHILRPGVLWLLVAVAGFQQLGCLFPWQKHARTSNFKAVTTTSRPLTMAAAWSRNLTVEPLDSHVRALQQFRHRFVELFA